MWLLLYLYNNNVEKCKKACETLAFGVDKWHDRIDECLYINIHLFEKNKKFIKNKKEKELCSKRNKESHLCLLLFARSW